ncbi:MAG: hypothetical protein R2828_29255 [Saprospiraceae bacterium]
MKDNKLIKLLSVFSRKEMTRFHELVHSPYFNKHEDVQRLVSFFDKIYPRFEDKNCHRHFIYERLFPGQKHDQPKLAILFTYTQRLVEEFLVQEQIKSANFLKDRLLLKGLRQRKQFTLYESVLDRTMKSMNEQSIRDSSYYQREYQLAVEADYFYTGITRKGRDQSLDQQLRSLDHYYLAEKLKSGVEVQIRRGILKQEYVNSMMQPVLREIAARHEEYQAIPAIDLYYRIYLMLTHSQTNYYFEALEILQAKEACFPKVELTTIYNYFQNYCIRQINANNPVFLKELFLLYRSQLQHALIIEDGYLSDLHYKNIVTTAIRLKELNWVKAFIENYRSFLRPEVMDNAYTFNLASYYHEIGEYHNVLELLTQVEYSDFRYNLGAKALLLRTYYELESFESLYSLVDSFLQYLHRNELLADSRRNGYYHLFRLTRRVAHLKSNWSYWRPEKRKKEWDKLQQEMLLVPAIFNKAWLEQKLVGLKTGLTS